MRLCLAGLGYAGAVMALLAGAVMITIPVLVFYLLVQRRLVVGLAGGGMKGE